MSAPTFALASGVVGERVAALHPVEGLIEQPIQHGHAAGAAVMAGQEQVDQFECCAGHDLAAASWALHAGSGSTTDSEHELLEQHPAVTGTVGVCADVERLDELEVVVLGSSPCHVATQVVEHPGEEPPGGLGGGEVGVRSGAPLKGSVQTEPRLRYQFLTGTLQAMATNEVVRIDHGLIGLEPLLEETALRLQL